MEINIDTVYQKVLALANKEQRGYITPQEFNLLADQAQMEIFEQYFYDQNQADRNLKNSTELSNVDEILDEKISIHKKLGTITMSGNVGTLPGDVYRLGTVFLASSQIELEQLTEEEALFLNLSPLARPTIDFPAYVRTGHDKIRTYPTMPSGVVCNYIILFATASSISICKFSASSVVYPLNCNSSSNLPSSLLCAVVAFCKFSISCCL